MQFPDFQDFLATLTPERVNEIYGGYQSIDITQIADIRDVENINAFISHVATQTVSHSLNLTLNLLQAYHEYLREQMP